MTSFEIREYRSADAEAVVVAQRAVYPYLIETPEMFDWRLHHLPPEERLKVWVAEGEAGVVGVVRAGIDRDTPTERPGFLYLSVAPEARGNGVGKKLLAVAEQHVADIGATRAHSRVEDDEASIRFAEKHGYVRSKRSGLQVLDLTGPLPGMPDLPAGVGVRSASSFDADPRSVHAVFAEALLDEPVDVPDVMPYDEWLATNWLRTGCDRDLSTVVTIDGEVASFSFVYVDGVDRCTAGFAGTSRSRRGRGLAKLAKRYALEGARQAGYRTAVAQNADENAPMRAVNAWLGFQPVAGQWSCIKDL